ncbi:U11/U12 small nuclear ribonucleoprotein 48 kDa protein [Temnothorax longispinosus]|uniref:U11/U12 small nuclear ribonucleoprotein 48 kDa protein n=1 Tax=Temnothorax longispinosus TaxID=300112 RepID=A0A4S2LBI7_9HYME|nr:U11/U12 small nuclear ribonucleoprotein 48 kDa protein [Temnothorax longispinosus]
MERYRMKGVYGDYGFAGDLIPPARDSTLVVRMFGLSFGFARRHGFRGDGGRDGRGRVDGNGTRGVAVGAGGDLLPAYGGVRQRHDAGSPMNGLMERAGRATQRARLTKRASSPQTPLARPTLLRLLG